MNQENKHAGTHKQYSQSLMVSASTCSTVVTLILPLSLNCCCLSKGSQYQREHQGDTGARHRTEGNGVSCRQQLLLWNMCQAWGHQPPPSSFLTFREPRGTSWQRPHRAPRCGHRQPPGPDLSSGVSPQPLEKKLVPRAAESPKV